LNQDGLELLGKINHLFEIAEDFAEVFQPAARTSDHYGPLPRIDEEICLRQCDRRRLSQITECRFKRLVIRWSSLKALSFMAADTPSESPAA